MEAINQNHSLDLAYWYTWYFALLTFSPPKDSANNALSIFTDEKSGQLKNLNNLLPHN